MVNQELTLEQKSKFSPNVAPVSDGSELRFLGENSSDSVKAFRAKPTGLDDRSGVNQVVTAKSPYDNSEVQAVEISDASVSASAFPGTPNGPNEDERFDLTVKADGTDDLLTLGSYIEV